MDLALDASAVVTMLHEELGFREYVAKVQEADRVIIGAPTVLEAGIVIELRAGRGEGTVREFLSAMRAEIIPFTEEHQFIALNAYRRFGRGRHPAALNFGDCMSYAVASLAELPLLYVGDDFAKTDIEAA